jgi:hypothetical protein
MDELLTFLAQRLAATDYAEAERMLRDLVGAPRSQHRLGSIPASWVHYPELADGAPQGEAE